MRAFTTILLLAGASVASADPKAPIAAAITPAASAEIVSRLEAIVGKASGATSTAPRFAFTGNLTLDPPPNLEVARMGFPDTALADPKKTLVAMPTPDTAWVSTYLGEYSQCGKTGCAKSTPDSTVRAVALFEKAADGWQPVAWSITPSIHAKAQLDAIDEAAFPEAITSRSEGADAVVTLFTTSLVDPKGFAATFADRKDVALMGSELGERFVGPQAKATIAMWGFGYTVRDGTRAGVTKSGTVAWVAANVDARSLKKPRSKALPFRVFALYEKVGEQWKLVQIQFSTSV